MIAATSASNAARASSASDVSDFNQARRFVETAVGLTISIQKYVLQVESSQTGTFLMADIESEDSCDISVVASKICKMGQPVSAENSCEGSEYFWCSLSSM